MIQGTASSEGACESKATLDWYALDAPLGRHGAPVALVTGASRGIGRAIALALARAGADLALTYNESASAAEQVRDEALSFGRQALCLQANAADHARALQVVEEIVATLGTPGILVNNAGATRDGVIWKMAESAWDDVIDLNLKGCFNYIRAVAPAMRAAGGGRIVSITSINALRGKFGQSNYTASKAGIIGLTKTVAREMGRSGVTVNAVAPGLIETEMAQALPDDVRDRALAETVLGRLGSVEDVAAAVLYLCSRGARHVTGEVLKVDGGQYL